MDDQPKRDFTLKERVEQIKLRTKKKLEKPHIMLLFFSPVLILVDLLIMHYVKAIRRIVLGLGIGGVSLGMILFVLRME